MQKPIENTGILAKSPHLLEQLAQWREQPENEKPRDLLARAIRFGNLSHPIFNDPKPLARFALLAFDNHQISEDQFVSMLLFRGALLDYPAKSHLNFNTYEFTPNNKATKAALKDFLVIQTDIIPGLQERFSDEQLDKVFQEMLDEELPASEKVFVTIDIPGGILKPILKRILETKFQLLMPVAIPNGYRLIVPSFSLIKKVLSTLKKDSTKLIPSIQELTAEDVLQMHLSNEHPFGVFVDDDDHSADGFDSGFYGFALHEIYHTVLLMFIQNMKLLQRLIRTGQKVTAESSPSQGADVLNIIIGTLIDAEFRQLIQPPKSDVLKLIPKSTPIQNFLTVLLRITAPAYEDTSQLEQIYREIPAEKLQKARESMANYQKLTNTYLAQIALDLINNAVEWQREFQINVTEFLDFVNNNGSQLTQSLATIQKLAKIKTHSFVNFFSNENKHFTSIEHALGGIQDIVQQVLMMTHPRAVVELSAAGKQFIHQYKDIRKSLSALIKANDSNAVKQLLQENSNFDCNYFDDEGYTPLQLAAKYGYVAIVNELLARNVLVDIRKSVELVDTAFILALEQQHLEVMSLLLEHHADIMAKNSNGDYAIDICIKNGFVAGLLLLLQKTSLSDMHINYLVANNSVHHNCVKLLSEYKQFKSDYRAALRSYGQELENFINNSDRRFTLNTILELDHEKSFYSPVHKEEDISRHPLSKELTYILPLQMINSEQQFGLLLKHGVNLNSQLPNGSTTSHLWLQFLKRSSDVYFGHCMHARFKAFVKLAIDGGANFHLSDSNGETMLTLAIRLAPDLAIMMLTRIDNITEIPNSYHVVIYLLDKVASQNGIWQPEDMTIMEALINKGLCFDEIGHFDLDTLFGKPKQMFVEPKATEVALWSMIRGYPILEKPTPVDIFLPIFRNSKVIGQVQLPLSLRKLALQKGAKPDAPGIDGATELHYAVSNNHLEYAEVLLKQNNVDVNARDAKGNTALHLAVATQNNFIGLLLEYGANATLLNNDKQTPHQYSQYLRQQSADVKVAAVQSDAKLASVAGHFGTRNVTNTTTPEEPIASPQCRQS